MSDIINIEIEGKHIKNAIDRQKGIKPKRLVVMEWDSCTKKYLLEKENHIKILEELCTDIEFDGRSSIIKELKKKLESYKNQDIKKKRYDKNYFITLNELLLKLKNSRLKCHYCLKDIKLAYDNVRIQIPVFPIDKLIDPTGAGDSFAGGFIGHLVNHGKDDLIEAVITGSAVASFTVSGFGVDGLLEANMSSIQARKDVIRTSMERLNTI